MDKPVLYLTLTLAPPPRIAAYGWTVADSETAELEHQILTDKQREQRHSADLREIELSERMRLLALRKDVQGVWDDGFARIASVIRSAKITNEQKKAIFEEIMTTKLEPLPDASE